MKIRKGICASFTDKEFNYIEGALRHKVRALEIERPIGNVPHLLWFTKRLLGKIWRIHEAGIRKQMGERKWKEWQRFIHRVRKDHDIKAKVGHGLLENLARRS